MGTPDAIQLLVGRWMPGQILAFFPLGIDNFSRRLRLYETSAVLGIRQQIIFRHGYRYRKRGSFRIRGGGVWMGKGGGWMHLVRRVCVMGIDDEFYDGC